MKSEISISWARCLNKAIGAVAIKPVLPLPGLKTSNPLVHDLQTPVFMTVIIFSIFESEYFRRQQF